MKVDTLIKNRISDGFVKRPQARRANPQGVRRTMVRLNDEGCTVGVTSGLLTKPSKMSIKRRKYVFLLARPAGFELFR